MARLNLAEGSAPATPASGYSTLYVDTSGNWHQLNDAGTDATLSVAGHTHATAGIDDAAVTNAKLANMAANTVKGRITASTGVPEDLTAANLLTIVKTVDGSGSGLDADTLDTYHAADFAAATHTHTEITDSGWQTPTIENTTYWSSSSTVKYRKIGKIVYFKGYVQRINDTSTNNTFLTLPEAYRPSETRVLHVPYYTSGDLYGGYCNVNTTGAMQFSSVAASGNLRNYYFDNVYFLVD